jgi:hypothetical protein
MKEFQSANKALGKTMQTHLINDLKGFGVWDDDYDLFLRERAEIVSAELKKRIIERRVDTQGQAIREDDLEEEATTFE